MESCATDALDGTPPTGSAEATLVRYPADAEDQLVAALLYGYAAHPLVQIDARVRALAKGEKIRILGEYLKRRGPYDQPLRALEHLTYTFDILVDFGAYRDIQRHRMVTQTPQETTALHGYGTPPEIARYGLTDAYRARMDEASRRVRRHRRGPSAGGPVRPAPCLQEACALHLEPARDPSLRPAPLGSSGPRGLPTHRPPGFPGTGARPTAPRPLHPG